MAEAEGYVLQFGCVSGSDSGAMGLHYINGALGIEADDPYFGGVGPQLALVSQPTRKELVKGVLANRCVLWLMSR